MIQFVFSKQKHALSHRGTACVVFVAALCLFSGTGCSLLSKREGRSTDYCRKCIESSFEAQKSGDLESAQEYLNSATEIQPGNADAWWNLAELSIQKDDFAKAEQELQKYIDLRPTDPQGYLRLAQLNYLQNQYIQADQYAQETLRRAPGNIDALLLSARLSRKQANHRQASVDYYHVLQLVPNHSEATLELAELFITQKEPTRAAPMLRALVRKSISKPDTARAYLNLGIAYGQMQRWEDAVAQLETASELNPKKNRRDQYRLAYAYWKAGTSQQALKSLLQIADAGKWSPRSEALYATITQTVPNYGMPDLLIPAGYQKQNEKTALLPSGSTEENALFHQILQPTSAIKTETITPPEWAAVP